MSILAVQVPTPYATRVAHAGVKISIFLNSSYFAATASSRVKWLQIGAYMLLIIISTGGGLFSGINIDDLE